MQYKVYSRPPLPRNKYGFVNNSTQIGGSFSSYYGDSSSFNGSVEELIGELKDFTGATQYEDGARGLVPAPAMGMQDYYFLKADGTWAYDPAYKWLHEWPEDNPRGLEIDGDFNVTGMLSTMDLNVQGTAHFWELVIDKVKATGGQLICSPSLFEVDWVGGTQIYEVKMDSGWNWSYGRQAIPYNNTSPWSAGEDITQWICPYSKNPSRTNQIFHIRNIVEEDFSLEDFRAFCLDSHIFTGDNVKDYTGSKWFVKGWGQYCTGFFEAELKDENGEMLPLTNGLPYDFDNHYMEYYKIWTLGDIDRIGAERGNGWGADTDAGHENAINYNYTWEGGLHELWYVSVTQVFSQRGTRTLWDEDYDEEFQNYIDSSSNLVTEWNRIANVRPDIWYRFFCDKVATETESIESDTQAMPPIPSLPEPPLTAEYNITWLPGGLFPPGQYPPPWPYYWLKYYQFAVPSSPKIGRSDYRYVQYFAKRLWMRCDDGTRRTFNECAIGDMLRCRSFNIKAGVYKNVSNKDFWTFVINTGEGTYTDDDGISHEAFYVDLVYALKAIRQIPGQDDQVKYFPIGTVFKNIGETTITPSYDAETHEVLFETYDWDYYCSIWDDEHIDIEVPSTWNQNMTQILNLKKVSKNTLCGLENVIEEFPTDEEFELAVELITSIRGIDSSLMFINAGTIAGQSSDEDTTTVPLSDKDRMDFEQDFYDYEATGKFPKNNLWLKSKVIRNPNSKIDSVEGNDYSDSEIDDANLLTFNILKGGRDSYDIAAASEEGDWPTINTQSSNALTEGRKLKLRETYHNYCSSEYYMQYKFGYGKWNVRTGDSFACLGNLYDQSRMNAIVISSTTPIDPELIPPSIAQYHLIDKFGESISTFRYTTIAKSGNTFFGSFNIDSGDGAYFQVDDKINLFITDIYNNLELVGIHLDGDNSTIKMIGNIELHQHADGDDDTFSVWDSEERKRVEILPKEIPSREDQDSILAAVNTKFLGPISTSWVAPKEPYIYYDEYKTGGILWHLIGGDKVAKYLINAPQGSDQYKTPFAFTVNIVTSLGTFGRDNTDQNLTIDISNLSIKCDTTNTYLLYGGNTERNLERYYPDLVILDMVPIKSIQNLVIKLRSESPTGPVVKSYTNQLPTYTTTEDGAVYNFNIYNAFIDNAELYFIGLSSKEYYLDVSFDVYPYCGISDIGRSTYYSFNGTAQTTGQFSITSNRQNSQGEHVDTSISQMMIGTNGMVFNQDNSRFFYAGEDGVEIRWDDSRLTLDDENGLCIAPGVYLDSTLGGSYPTKKDCVVYSDSQDVTLPNPSTYGEGRRLTIIGTPSCVRSYTGTVIRVGWWFDNTFSGVGRFTSDFNLLRVSPTWSVGVEGGLSALNCCWIGAIEFIAYAGMWHVCSGLTPSLAPLHS